MSRRPLPGLGGVHETLHEEEEEDEQQAEPSPSLGGGGGGGGSGSGSGSTPASPLQQQVSPNLSSGADSAEDHTTRPGPRPLYARHTIPSSSSSHTVPPSSDSSKTPAAGAGSRVRPNPVPKDSSSLRHISFRSRLASIPPSQGELEEPAAATFGRVKAIGLCEADALGEELEEEQGEEELEGDNSRQAEQSEEQRRRRTGESWTQDVYGQQRQRKRRQHRKQRLKQQPVNQRGVLSVSSSSSSSATDTSDSEGEEDQSAPPPASSWLGSASRSAALQLQREQRKTVRRAPWHRNGPSADGESPPLLAPGGMLTPGIHWPQTVNTPLGTPPEPQTPEVEPRIRLEWQTMLESVLASEVLRSETKRITSVDAAVATREEQMYARWLDIRASLRGRGHLRGAVEAEEKRLSEGWGVMVRDLIRDIKACRPEAPPQAPPSNSNLEATSTPASDTASLGGDAAPQHTDDASLAAAVAVSSAHTAQVMAEIGALLARVDSAEEQFPSLHKMEQVVPEWAEPALQAKLGALYSWYNVASALQLQLRILQQWTGSETLAIEAAPSQSAEEGAEVEAAGTFVERILKANSLQGTFEKRTLSALNALILKAKRVIYTHHEAFSRMALPSFEPLLVQLINFPTRLVLGALRLRLDYAGKLREPSLLIVDSLTDDLRAALALACRVRLQYSNTMVPEPESGWDLPPCIGEGYDATLREALRFFFKLLNFKLKGAVFFKETEILEPEWRFLSTAAHVIEGGDVIVARSVTKIVNKLFARIVTYFERELSAPSTRRGEVMGEAAADAGTKAAQARGNSLTGPSGEAAGRGPSTAGGLTRGKVRMTLEEKVKWIHAVFENVRIRSRKLLGFARDIRNRLENAAEYDLGSLASSTAEVSGEESTDRNSDTKQTTPNAMNVSPTPHATMDLNAFLQTLINAGYFLVLTATFEPEGVYLIAEPSLHDKPELIQELFCRCMRRPSDDEDTALAAEANAMAAALAVGETRGGPHVGEDDASDANDGASAVEDDEASRYLLLLSPRDAFMWTGRIMTLKMPHIGVDLKERRLRLIADGPKRRLELCKAHFYAVFREAAQAARAAESPPSLSQSSVPPVKGNAARAVSAAPEEPAPSPFPLEVINETMAHMSAVQAELRKVNKGVYMLSDTVIRAVPSIRRNLRGRRINGALPRGGSSEEGSAVTWSKCDELIQNCFNMGAEQGFRSLPFIESDRLRGQMTLALARLSIDWVAFICDDCVPGERKTFKWAVAALENAMQVTRSENIFQLSEDDFGLMRTKVASCMALLISQFDILGARSSVAQAQEEQERLKREHTERDRVRASDAVVAAAMQASPGLNSVTQAAATLDAERKQLAAKMVHEMGGAGAPSMLNRHDSGMQATEERWVQKVMEWDAARQAIEAEQRLIGRVLDDARPEDRGLQFLASSSSRIQIRWQQGRFIGGGTFGTVYLAVNLDSGGLMAVKEIRFQDISSSPQLYKQIKDEMNVMEMLSHPNIVEYYGIEVHRDKVYIFEEYCEGGSLAQLLEHGRIEDEVVIQVYTLQMLDGLVYLHSKGVVHRDIKPDNILLDHLGVIKFVDFGAAKILAKNSRTIQRSRRVGGAGGAGAGAAGGLPIMGPDGKMQPGAMASLQGTPMYMSPEVIKGETRGRRGAMDVWSLGCVVLEFATGRRPWSQLDNEWAIMFHIGMAQQHPPLPEQGQLSESGIDFIRQCLIIDPYERPSAAEMRAHPWIQDLIEELKAANEEAAGADAGTGSDFSSPMVHANDSSAGVAALAATPGTRSINGFNFGRPTLNAGLASMHRSEAATSTSSFSRLSLGGADTPGVAHEASEAETDSIFAEDAAIHVPSAQQHEQEALADRAYDAENAERHRLNHIHLPTLTEAARATHESFPEE